MIIKAKQAYIDGAFVADAAVTVEGNIITHVDKNAGDSGCDLDLNDLTLLPGLIDIHAHGGAGCDTMGAERKDYSADALAEEIRNVARFKLRDGVTRFCPATVTAGLAKTDAAIEAIKRVATEGTDGGAAVVGGFLEGPFIAERYKGAHPAEHIKDVDVTLLDRWLASGAVASVAIAPEKDGAIDAIKYLKGRGVNVRIGHSAATFEQSKAAVDAGANVAIHTFNAMSPFNHRAAGLVGEVFLDGRLFAELICDGIHVCPEAMRVLYKLKGPNGIVLVSDSMCATGMEDGRYMLGELAVTVTNGVARTENGALAGSTLSMLQAVTNMRDLVGVPLEHALQMATLNAARALGLDETLGSITVGKTADLIAVDDHFKLHFTMVNGT